MKNQMTKKEILNIKLKAKHRKNRRLSDSEFQRLIDRASSCLALNDSKKDLPIIDRKNLYNRAKTD
jgi:hypothetical protein